MKGEVTKVGPVSPWRGVGCAGAPVLRLAFLSCLPIWAARDPTRLVCTPGRGRGLRFAFLSQVLLPS